ncbi:acyl-CoA dehydrogenase family protein [Streptomyces lateritius]|uniref:acyl-CoA dehydrogenase family protein n=1 Tax=Streptomyces lateritius TaxID=67313 RepID=UPI001672DCF5|nr:acyl-CoA dehydrogenase family protein [Streptomyces lateritius]GGT78917.1 monooxygenase [Streptomyces lateritius]
MRTPRKSAKRPTSGQPERPADDEIWPRVTRELADDLAVDAPARDRAGKAPFDEVARLKEAGLPALLTPPGPSGHGADWQASCAVIREISAADGSIGELLAHHYVLSFSTRFFADDPAGDTAGDTARDTASGPGAAFEDRTAREGWLLAGAVEPPPLRADGAPGLTLAPSGRGYVLEGRRSFASGVTVADRLVVGARCSSTGDVRVALVDPGDPAVFTEAGTDRVGQRLAGAGTVTFDAVPVDARDVLGTLPRDEHAVAPFTALAPLALRLLLVHVGLGIAEGALAEARDISRATHAAPTAASADPVAGGNAYPVGGGEDPYLLLAYGELATAAHAAAAVVERATDALARGLLAARALGVEERADIAVLVAAAETVTGRSAVRITTRILELVDTARECDAPGGGPGLDRFWRNARALTAQSSPDHRLRDIGDHYLNGTRPRLTLLA